MKFSVGVRDTKIVDLLQDLVQITCQEAWVHRFEWLAREYRDKLLMGGWLKQRCAIE